MGRGDLILMRWEETKGPVHPSGSPSLDSCLPIPGSPFLKSHSKTVPRTPSVTTPQNFTACPVWYTLALGDTVWDSLDILVQRCGPDCTF